jgi:Domain of unknown function (DUF1833)
MSNILSPELLAQLFGQTSDDPFLTLATLSHPSFASDIRLVNNTKDIVSRGQTFRAFPMNVRLPVDDGETAREFNLELDNASLELIEEIRSVTTAINIKLEMILASIPDEVQISQEDLTIVSLNYNKNRIVAKISMDSFLNVEMTSERYGPTNFPGVF